ncbi:hypothetical protein L0337_24575 [candidate division KSB1 bacterium]|nr:hypothetical protein [candidate division KSB1 bacterium]
MEPITENFLEEYLRPQTRMPRAKAVKWTQQVSKEFEQAFPVIYKAYVSSLAPIQHQNPLFAQLAFELGMMMFDAYRAFYGGFLQVEREGLWDEMVKRMAQITPKASSGVGIAHATEIMRRFVKQDSLIALCMLKVEAFVYLHPEAKPSYTEVFACLTVLATVLNKLVELPKKEIKPVPKSYMKKYELKHSEASAAERKKRTAQIKAKFCRFFPELFANFSRAVKVFAETDEGTAELALELGMEMFDIYLDYYGGFSRPEHKKLWEEQGVNLFPVFLAYRPKSGFSRKQQKTMLNQFIRQDPLITYFTKRIEHFIKVQPQSGSLFTILILLAAGLDELV